MAKRVRDHTDWAPLDGRGANGTSPQPPVPFPDRLSPPRVHPRESEKSGFGVNRPGDSSGETAPQFHAPATRLRPLTEFLHAAPGRGPGGPRNTRADRSVRHGRESLGPTPRSFL